MPLPREEDDDLFPSVADVEFDEEAKAPKKKTAKRKVAKKAAPKKKTAATAKAEVPKAAAPKAAPKKVATKKKVGKAAPAAPIDAVVKPARKKKKVAKKAAPPVAQGFGAGLFDEGQEPAPLPIPPRAKPAPLPPIEPTVAEFTVQGVTSQELATPAVESAAATERPQGERGRRRGPRGQRDDRGPREERERRETRVDRAEPHHSGADDVEADSAAADSSADSAADSAADRGDEYGRTAPLANYVVHVYELGHHKRTIPRDFTPEAAEAYATEFTRTAKRYGREAVAGKKDTQPPKELPAPQDDPIRTTGAYGA